MEGTGPADGPGEPGADEGAESWRAELRAHRPSPELAIYGWLLALVLATFVLVGVGGESDATRILLTLLAASISVLSMYVAKSREAVKLVVAAVAVGSVIAALVQVLSGNVSDGALRLIDCVLLFLALPAILLGVIRRLQATRAVTIEAVLGVVSVYVLIGMFFAFVFGAMDHLGAAPFFDQNVAGTASRFQYYSFTTLATVGYGDLTAKSNVGHTLSVSEALLGQVYLVTVVSLIVGNLGRRRR